MVAKSMICTIIFSEAGTRNIDKAPLGAIAQCVNLEEYPTRECARELSAG